MTRDDGFTVLEVLVAVLVFALLSLAGAAIMRSSIDASDRLGAANDRLAALQLARTTLRNDLSQIAIRPTRDAYGGRGQPGFAAEARLGDGPLIRFVRRGWTNPGAGEARASLQYVEYRLEGDILYRLSRPRLDPAPTTAETRLALLTGVSGVSLSYLSGGRWSDRWMTAAGGAVNRLPDAIAIDMDTRDFGHLRQVIVTGAS